MASIKVSSRILMSKLIALSVVVMYDDSDGGMPVAAFTCLSEANEYIASLVLQDDYASRHYIYEEAL
jgi:hypothetical protein